MGGFLDDCIREFAYHGLVYLTLDYIQTNLLKILYCTIYMRRRYLLDGISKNLSIFISKVKEPITNLLAIVDS